MWCESSDRGTLISEIHPGGLCPASSLSVQTLNFPTKTTRITAQPFSSHSISHPLMLSLYLSPSPSYHYIFKTQAHKSIILCANVCGSETKANDITNLHTELPLSWSDDERCCSYTNSSHTIMMCTFHCVYETIQTTADLIISTEHKTLFWCHFEKWDQWEPWQTR